ncbi:MAG: CAP domain-containing protein [bacterium]|nr:CAP domain-containing protein [bacterium]
MRTFIAIIFGLLNSLVIFLFPNQIKKAELPAASGTVKTIVKPAKIIVPMPTPAVKDNTPWGTTIKIGDHLYRTYVGEDTKMGTPEEILIALNLYRKNHGVGSVRSDENICKFAQERASTQNAAGNLDSHKGFQDFMNKPDSWRWLDVKSVGENASYGYVLSGTHLIEWVFDSDIEHKENQLNPAWNLACAGISGVTVDIIFGQR